MQGCTAEACQILSLISSLIDQPGMQEGFHRHGVLEFLSWRLDAEALLNKGLEAEPAKFERCIWYLPEDRADSEVFIIFAF